MASKKVLNVPPIDFKIGGSAYSPVASLVTSMVGMGERVAYPYLMGLSGGAFRLYWMDGFDASSARVASDAPARVGARALGYSYLEYSDTTDATTWKLVKGSIDEEVPVPACGIVPPTEWQVICGYSGSGKSRKLHVESYFDPDPAEPSVVSFKRWKGWASHGDVSMPFAIIRKRGMQPSSHLAAFEALSRAVLLAHEQELFVPPAGAAQTGESQLWHAGLAAYDAWVADLKKDVTAKEAVRKLAVNDLCGYTLLDSRICAASFMDALSGEFPSARPHLREAKAGYEKVVGLITEARELVPYDWEKHPKVPASAGKPFMDRDNRLGWMLKLKRARDAEAKAVAALEAAAATLH
jgi:hypothetical protein